MYFSHANILNQGPNSFSSLFCYCGVIHVVSWCVAVIFLVFLLMVDYTYIVFMSMSYGFITLFVRIL